MNVQISMLRMWADSIERFACNYEKALKETANTVSGRGGGHRSVARKNGPDGCDAKADFASGRSDWRHKPRSQEFTPVERLRSYLAQRYFRAERGSHPLAR